MIVDDNSDMRRMLRSIITDESKELNEYLDATDGNEAVEQYSHFHPDVVLMDIQMKNMNGFAAAEKIYEQAPDAKVVFVTSFDTEVFRKKAEQLHSHGFVTKDKLSKLGLLLQSFK